MAPPNRRVNRSTPRRRPKVAGANRPAVDRVVDNVEDAPTPSVLLRKPDKNSEPAPSPARALRDWRLTAILAGAALVLGVFALVAYFKPGAEVTNEAFVDNPATEQVKAAAANAIVTLAQYKYDKIDDWRNAGSQVFTDKMKDEFNKTADATKDFAVQSHTSTTARVDDVGVTALDGDRAEVIVFVAVSVDRDGVAVESRQGPQVVRMEKVGDKWLLAEVVPN